MTRALPLLSPAEAAQELCISQKHLRALTCAGEIRYVNIGLGDKREKRRYDPDDLDAFREARRCQSTRGPAARSTATTSVIVGIDFQARREKRRSEKLNASKLKNAGKRKLSRPAETSP